MGKMREYFGRGFIGAIDDSLKITIVNDEYYEGGMLKKLVCQGSEDDYNKIKEYRHRIVKLKITGAKTMRRKEEFNFEEYINIDKIVPEINNMNSKIRFSIQILNK
ncbi:hypothetical protein [Clostridium sp. CMCC3677]|uniref:hypothetical protein n=1 Tax=Clostridium sp. CMCC3677 TaxID=2949963 RepID=UPI0013F114B8|nr:hypothetical protein [Clostridium sp. CMCC3677]NFG63154.1 hypothetical protein [Clostridium botulinum]NFQ10961.1 hypothetical protein [Clostridium botulinum]